MSLDLRRFLSIALVLGGCASWHGGVSVESVLRATETVGAELDRGPASLGPRFQQPLRKMQVTSAFGRRHQRAHAGVDLKADTGTPIYAAADGIVIYADDRINGYGLTVILRHRRRYATLYAHASELRVKNGDVVTRGECIAYAGDSGNATGPHLHFEIRNGVSPVDPLTTLASLRPGPAPKTAEPALTQPADDSEEPATLPQPTRPPTSEELTEDAGAAPEM